jgi:glutamate dehydrogenase (NAD(P)+)
VTIQFSFADELGPEKVIQIYEPDTQLNAILVVDNVAAGPSIGGVRMAIDVSASECFRLARAMTLKNAMAGLAHGGGKSVIAADPAMSDTEKVSLIRSFARAITDIGDYIPGPDMGTNEVWMAQIKNVTGRAVGLPREIGGIPLDEIGATGFGLMVALEAAQQFCDLELNGARVVVQGFGSVGQHAARFLEQRGALLVGVADSRGARFCESGFDLDRLLTFKAHGGSVAEFEQGDWLDSENLIAIPCDIWIPAARPDAIREDNVGRIQTKVVVQGANIPATIGAEQILADRGVLVIPDFVANAGGVICAAVEYRNGTEAQAMVVIEEKIRTNVRQILARVAISGDLPRQAAMDIAQERVRRAMSFRLPS